MTLEQVIEKLEDSGVHEIVLEPYQLLGWLKELRDTRELESKHWSECMQIARYDDELKTADVQPVKRGKWEICSDGYYPYCSECKAEPESGKMTNYCPRCGADMRGDTE